MNDTESTEIVRHNSQIAGSIELTPDGLQAEIERQSAMRRIMTDYVRSQMVEGHHYYSFNTLGKDSRKGNIKADKPALTQDGAFLLCGLFKVIPGPIKTEVIRHDDGHSTVTAEAPFYNQDGALIASGNGICSTRESKYAYRWVSERDVPKDIERATLKTRSGSNQNGGKWMQYQLPNSDIADLENTALKMACKRASVAGVRKFPLVSELFSGDAGETPAEKPQAKPVARRSAAAPAAEQDDADLDELRQAVEELLAVKIGETPEQEQFLKGRQVDQMGSEALNKLLGDLQAM